MYKIFIILYIYIDIIPFYVCHFNFLIIMDLMIYYRFGSLRPIEKRRCCEWPQKVYLTDLRKETSNDVRSNALLCDHPEYLLCEHTEQLFLIDLHACFRLSAHAIQIK